MNSFARKSKSKGSQEKNLRLDSSNSEVPDPKHAIVVDDSDEEVFPKKATRRNRNRGSSHSSHDE